MLNGNNFILPFITICNMGGSANIAGLEGSLSEAPARVGVLDDTEAILRVFLPALNKKGREYSLGFTGTRFPDVLYEAATRDSSLHAVVLDIFFKELPADMRSRFRNGIELASAIRNVRGDSIDIILMSAREMEGQRIIDLVKDNPYIDGTWQKPGTPDELFKVVHAAISKRPRPEFPRYFIVTGPPGVGKSSTAGYLSKRMRFLRAFMAATTRKQRSGDVDNQALPELFRRIEHEFLTLPAMHKRITEARKPLIYTKEGILLTKKQYLKLGKSSLEEALSGTDIYMLDLSNVEKAHAEGNDVMVITPVIEIAKVLRGIYGSMSHVVVLEASDISRLRRLAMDGRPTVGIDQMLEEEKALDPRYRKLADTVIGTELASRQDYDNSEYARELVIGQVQDRIVKVRTALMGTPYSTPPSEVNSSHVANAERTLAALAGEAVNLEKGKVLKIPFDTVQSYYEWSKGAASLGVLHMLEHFSSMAVLDVTTKGGIRYVRIVPEELTDIPEPIRNNESWGHVTKGLVSSYLRQKGIEAVQPGTLSQSEGSIVPDSSRLVFSLTGKPKGSEVYSLELLFY